MSNRKYTVTLTEHQLRLIAQCVEDCHRFAAGKTETNLITNHIRKEKMEITFHDKKYRLPQIAQYQSIPYEAGLCCSHCSNFVREYKGWMEEMKSDRVIGYCVDGEGAYQIVLECKYCHEKYRFHMDKHWYQEDGKILFDVEHWKREVGLHLFMGHHDYLEIVTKNKPNK